MPSPAIPKRSGWPFVISSLFEQRRGGVQASGAPRSRSTVPHLRRARQAPGTYPRPPSRCGKGEWRAGVVPDGWTAAAIAEQRRALAAFLGSRGRRANAILCATECRGQRLAAAESRHEGTTMRFGAHYLPTYIPELDGPEPEFYRRMFEQAELLDALGYDDFWVTEHHFNEYGG